MKEVTGVVMIIAGAILGLYVGVWVCFVGGIIDVIQSIRAEHLVVMSVAIGIAKVVFAGLAGWFSAAVLLIPGFVLLSD